MRIGTVEREEPRYADRWHETLGDYVVCVGRVVVKLERYECEHCGRVHDVQGVATEPFYCGGATCGRLVGV